MTGRRRLPLAIALFLAAVPAAALAPALAPRAGHAQAADSAAFLPLRGQRRVLFETRDGRFLTAKPVGILGDSLWLDRPVSRYRTVHFRLARADVARAFVHRKNPWTMALVEGAAGFAGGSLVAVGLGSNRQGFGFDAGEVLGVGAVNGALKLPVGALIGVLWPAWRQAVPPPGDASGPAIEPFPSWSVSALGGVVDPSADVGRARRLGATVAAWRNMSPQMSWGYEYGTLSRESFHFSRPAFVDTFFNGSFYVPAQEEDAQDRWAYSSLEFRFRFGRQGVRPLLSFGFGSYLRSVPFNESFTDSTGAVTRVHGRDVESHLGGNAGLGVTWGRGPKRPEIELRCHAVRGAGLTTWITLQAGLLYQ